MVNSFLRLRATALCFGLALLVCAVVSWHTIGEHVLPIADGEGYAMRGFALYGYLHTGQWAQFVDLLTRPGQSIFPLHYLPFLLLPKALAGVAAYVILQNLTTYLVMAYALVLLTTALDRREWAPAIFLLWCVNNIGLIDFYTFFLDMQFSAVATLALAWQIAAWRGAETRAAVWSGVTLGALFFVKPANALIVLALYLLSEIIWVVRTRRASHRNAAFKLAAFVPVVSVAVACGAGQTILQLIDQNEVHEGISPLVCSGLTRFFYFPFCFSACYHLILLGSLLFVAGLVGRWISTRARTGDVAPFAINFLIPVAVAYFIFGEFFSFWMIVKPIRALLIMLPSLWIFVAWIWDRFRLRPEALLAVAVFYTGIVFAQKEYNLTGTRDHLVEDNYQLTASSWREMPSPWRHGATLNQIIGDQIIASLPPSGVICVNLIESRNALAWRLRKEDLLAGNVPRYDVRNLFDYRGQYFDHALVGANVVALITLFRIQSSRTGWLQTMGVVGYGAEQWCGNGARAQQVDLPTLGDEAIGTEFIFAQPLSQPEVDLANQAAPLAGARRVPGDFLQTDTLRGRLYSKGEAWSLIRAWIKKRLN